MGLPCKQPTPGGFNTQPMAGAHLGVGEPAVGEVPQEAAEEAAGDAEQLHDAREHRDGAARPEQGDLLRVVGQRQGVAVLTRHHLACQQDRKVARGWLSS